MRVPVPVIDGALLSGSYFPIIHIIFGEKSVPCKCFMDTCYIHFINEFHSLPVYTAAAKDEYLSWKPAYVINIVDDVSTFSTVVFVFGENYICQVRQRATKGVESLS